MAVKREVFVKLWELPSASNLCELGPWMEADGFSARICFDYQRESGGYELGSLDFSRVESITCTRDFFFAEGQADAFDELVEIERPDVMPVPDIHPTLGIPALPPVRHYRICFGDICCFEIFATGWAFNPSIGEPLASSVLHKRPRPSSTP